MECYVYFYKDHEGTVRYVGKGSGNRAASHIGLAASLNKGRRKDRATHFTRWLAKCLRENKLFWYEFVATGLSDDQAFALEQKLISEYKRHREGGTLYNTLSGGEGFTREDAKLLSNRPATKKKKSLAVRLALSDPEVKARLRAATKEANNRPHRIEQQRLKAFAEWQNPERRVAAAKRAKELWSDPIWSSQRRKELIERNKRLSSSKKLERAAHE